MIAFVSIFLGLIAGPQIVELAVSGSVAAVEIRLDGETVATVRSAPWELEVDFGAELTTHELVAIARDQRGVPLAVAKQLINVPRSPVETELLLDGWRHEVPSRGQLIWHSIEKLEPTAITVRLDGRPLALGAGHGFKLPDLASRRLHFLSAELEFPNGIVSTAEAVFGGVFGTTVRSDITAVPLFVEGALPEVETLGRWLTSGGEALDVVAVGKESAEIIVVVDEKARKPFFRLALQLFHNRGKSYAYTGLEKEDTVRVLSAQGRLVDHARLHYSVFPQSEPFTVEDAPLPDMLWGLEFSEPGTEGQALVDAVAVGGLGAAASQKRRAVVLAVADCAAASGRWSVASVRRYLAELHVPLVVWQAGPAKGDPTRGFCAEAERLTSGRQLALAIRRLRKTLKRQRIVWVEGDHLPRAIALAEEARGLRLVD